MTVINGTFCPECNTGFTAVLRRCPVCRRSLKVKREASRRNAESMRKHITSAKRRRIYERDANVCLRCGTDTGLTLDHIVPIAKGGTNHDDNLQTLCGPCNNRKQARTINYRGPEGIEPTEVTDRVHPVAGQPVVDGVIPNESCAALPLTQRSGSKALLGEWVSPTRSVSLRTNPVGHHEEEN